MKWFLLQLILFMPSFFIYIRDVKTIGKENLAVGLGERFLAWLIVFPIWIIPILAR